MIPIQDSVPRRCPPIMTWTLIFINTAIFFMETMLPGPLLEQLFYTFGLVPVKYTHLALGSNIGGDLLGLWPFFTCMFLHGGWVHIIGNMWTLWIFGDNVEDEMGSFRFLVFYVLSGIAASIIQVGTNPLSNIPTIGASGAIAGVMGAYYVLFPRARIILMVPLFFIPFFFEVPAVFYLGFWFFEQLFSGTFSLVATAYESNIAWWAHAGGFAFGMLFHRFFLWGARFRPCMRYKDELRPWGMLGPRERV